MDDPKTLPQGLLHGQRGFAVPLVVAVTGHRDLLPSELPGIRDRVTQFLSAMQRDYPDRRLRVMSPLAEGADVDGAGPEAHAGGVDLAEAGLVHEDPAALDRRDQAEDAGRVGAGGHHDDVVDAPDGMAVAVDQRQPDEAGDEDRTGHAGTLPPDPGPGSNGCTTVRSRQAPDRPASTDGRLPVTRAR